MNLPGPLSVQPTQPVSDLQNGLRVNQRITGQVLQISGPQVQVSIDGVPVIASMSSRDQAALLHPGQTAHFTVKDISGGTLTLQLLRPSADGEPAAPQAGAGDMAGRVLQQAGLPVNPQTLLASRALLCQGLEVTPAAVTELLNALEASGSLSEETAGLGAALMAAGVPVTPQSLALFKNSAHTSETLIALLQTLRAAAGSNTAFPGTQADLQRAVQSLELAMPGWDQPAMILAQQVRTAVQVFGRSLENLFSALVDRGTAGIDYHGHATIFDLARLLKQANLQPSSNLAEQLKDLLDGLRQNQLLNSGRTPSPSARVWSEMEFVLRAPAFPNQQGRPDSGEETCYPARLYLARRQDGAAQRIDPEYTRLVIQVEVAPDQTVQADISLVKKDINLALTFPEDQSAAAAREKLEDLEENLNSLGYRFHAAKVEVGAPGHFDRIPAARMDEVPGYGVNMKV